MYHFILRFRVKSLSMLLFFDWLKTCFAFLVGLQWSQKNSELLKVKDAQEAVAKQAAITKAKEQIAKFYEVSHHED